MTNDFVPGDPYEGRVMTWEEYDEARFDAKCRAMLQRQIGPRRVIFPTSEQNFSREEISSWCPQYIQAEPPEERRLVPWIIGLAFAVPILCFGSLILFYYLQKGF